MTQFQFYALETDLSQENEYEIGFYRSKWNTAFHIGEFAFRADGTDLAADTKRIRIGRVFELPDGVRVTLNEFTTNELEQRITYSLSAQTDYILKVKATDSAGKQAEFGVRVQGPESGYMQNEKMIEDGSVYDGRLEESAESADMTLYAVKLSKENGAVREEYAQVGESFLVEF